MKVKALRNKYTKEFIHIEEMGGEPQVFTSELPKLQPETATIELMQKFYEEEDYFEDLEVRWEKFEFVEFDLIEFGEIGADIRNKLTPSYNLVALVELFLKEEDSDKKSKLKKLIKKEIIQSKESVKYIANLL